MLKQISLDPGSWRMLGKKKKEKKDRERRRRSDDDFIKLFLLQPWAESTQIHS